MKKIRFIILFSLLFLSVYPVSAQRLRYKDIYQVITSGDNVLAYSLLLEYQKSNPGYANTYFQLGLISFNNILNADPFLEYDKIKYFAYNVRLYWGLAEKYIQNDKSEVTRNRKYFQNVPELAKIKRISQEDVLGYISTRLNKVNDYVKELDKIYSLFYKMVSDYTRTVDHYRHIIADYAKLKDLYLSPTDEIFPRLDTIRILFDSTMNMYQLYRAAIESYPLKKYNQHLLLKPITLYRLEGVTNTDFLNDTIVFWNYGLWVKDVKDVILGSIMNMRTNIAIHYNSMMALERKFLKTKVYSDKYLGYFLPSPVIYQIEKYDINSIMTNLLEYNKIKTDFLAYRLHVYNDTTDSLTKLIVRANSYAHEDMLLTQMDSMLRVISELNVPENTRKYEGFFHTNFPHGLAPYIAKERVQNLNMHKKDFEHFKYFLYRDVFHYSFDSSYVVYNNDTIKLFISTGQPSKYVTMDVGKDPLNNLFVAGVENSGHKWKIFVCKLTNTTVQWLKTMPINKDFTVPQIKLYPYTDGVVIDVYETSSQAQGNNTFYRFDQIGEQGFTFRSNVRSVPRFIYYDDINNFLIAAYKGNDREEPYSADTLIIEKWDINKKQKIWRYNFVHTGQFVNVLRYDSVYYAFVNYTKFVGTNGKAFRSGANDVGVIRITESGKIMPFRPLEKTKYFYLIYTIKLSSQKFDVLGFQASPFDFKHEKFGQLPPLKSIIINKF